MWYIFIQNINKIDGEEKGNFLKEGGGQLWYRTYSYKHGRFWWSFFYKIA